MLIDVGDAFEDIEVEFMGEIIEWEIGTKII